MKHLTNQYKPLEYYSVTKIHTSLNSQKEQLEHQEQKKMLKNERKKVQKNEKDPIKSQWRKFQFKSILEQD